MYNKVSRKSACFIYLTKNLGNQSVWKNEMYPVTVLQKQPTNLCMKEIGISLALSSFSCNEIRYTCVLHYWYITTVFFI